MRPWRILVNESRESIRTIGWPQKQSTRTPCIYSMVHGIGMHPCSRLELFGTITAESTLDDVIKWNHFPRYWPFERGIHWSPVNSPHKGQWLGALMFSLICSWINVWVNNREAGELRRHRAHYDVIVMQKWLLWWYRTDTPDFSEHSDTSKGIGLSQEICSWFYFPSFCFGWIIFAYQILG